MADTVVAPPYRVIPIIPALKPDAMKDVRSFVANEKIQGAIGFPGQLVDDWQERALAKMGELLGQYRSLKVYMDACVHCGACSDKCHYFIGTQDPKNMPVARQDLMRSVYRRYFTVAGKLFPKLVGARDLTVQVFTSMPGSELLVHGVAVAPGKPFIWVRAGSKNLLGLPGQVASCLVAYYVLVEPVIERLLGREPMPFTRFGRAKAMLTRNLPSVHGREEYLRVRLLAKDGQAQAEPVFGKSGLLRTLVEGDGLVRVERDREGIKAGAEVTVLTWPAG